MHAAGRSHWDRADGYHGCGIETSRLQLLRKGVQRREHTFPAPGGPSRRVVRPGVSTLLTLLRMVILRFSGRYNLSWMKMNCRAAKQALEQNEQIWTTNSLGAMQLPAGMSLLAELHAAAAANGTKSLGLEQT